MAIGVVYMRDGFNEELDSFSYVLKGTVGHLARRLGSGDDARQVLCDSWKLAKQWGMVVDERGSVSFPIWRPSDTPVLNELPNSSLVATLKPCTFEEPKHDWVVSYAGPDTRHILDRLSDDIATPRNIYDFAYLQWDDVLDDVSRRALDEPWGFGDGDTSILKSYLIYTYQRAAIQNKVFVSADAGLAVFNTGLVTSTYEDLYLCFKPNNRSHPNWVYHGVCVVGERGLGKRLVDSFPKMPERASYIEDVSDLVFDNSREFYPDSRHMLVDNVDRLPIGFLRAQMYDRLGISSLLDDLDHGEDSSAIFARLREELEDDAELLLRLINRLDDAIRLARRRTQWNYRTAVPCYYPVANEMSLLLPLCLQNPRVPDAALVVSIAPSGSYQGETILTMQQAYLDARLICRPEDDWLVPQETQRV